MADYIQMAALAASQAASASSAPAGENPMAVEQEVVAETTIDGDAEHHVSPSALGFDASMLVALAMLFVILIALWAKVPALIAGALDKQIAGIKEQLDAATKLRAEAEAIKAEYVAKSKQAAYDAEQMKLHAEEEAKQIVANAKQDAAAMIVRRTKMAEEKIAAAEANAIADVRAKAAAVSAAAAEQLIAASTNAKADAALIDQAISALN